MNLRRFFLQFGCLPIIISSIISSPCISATKDQTDLVIIFDTSGSMDEHVGTARKIDIAKDSMWKFVDSLPKSVNLGLIIFDGACAGRVIQSIRISTEASRKQIKSIIAGLKPAGKTPLADSLRKATALLQASTNKKRILVMTDGEETCMELDLAGASDNAWQNDIKVYAVGFAFGGQPSQNLRRIGIYKDANDQAQLNSVFKEIKQNLEKDAASYDKPKAQASSDEIPPQSLVGRRGHFRSVGVSRAGKLFNTLQLGSSYESRFTEQDKFTVLEHGYTVLFDENEFKANKVEVLKVKLEEKPNFIYGGVEGFVFLDDIVIE